MCQNLTLLQVACEQVQVTATCPGCLPQLLMPHRKQDFLGKSIQRKMVNAAVAL